MYKKQRIPRTIIAVNEGYIGEAIEAKVRRIVNNKEPITDGAQLIYTERKDGVMPEYNIRTDKWEVAIEALDKVDKTRKAIREERHKTPEQKEQDKIAAEAKKNMGKEGETNVGNN